MALASGRTWPAVALLPERVGGLLGARRHLASRQRRRRRADVVDDPVDELLRRVDVLDAKGDALGPGRYAAPRQRRRLTGAVARVLLGDGRAVAGGRAAERQ